MVYPQTHLYVTFHWAMVGTDERGQTGVRFPLGDVPEPSEIAAARAATIAFWTHANAAISSTYTLDTIKYALIDASGHYPPGHVPAIDTWAGTAGGSGGTTFPFQTSAVASLVGVIPRGQAGKGRLYLPPIQTALVAGTGRWAASPTTNRATQVATWLSALRTALGGAPEIFSSKGAGAQQVIVSVRQGDRPDVQRRRANALDEAYSGALLP